VIVTGEKMAHIIDAIGQGKNTTEPRPMATSSSAPGIGNLYRVVLAHGTLTDHTLIKPTARNWKANTSASTDNSTGTISTMSVDSRQVAMINHQIVTMSQKLSQCEEEILILKTQNQEADVTLLAMREEIGRNKTRSDVKLKRMEDRVMTALTKVLKEGLKDAFHTSSSDKDDG
jgi:hypothetical protein